MADGIFTIESLAFGGKGIARESGKVWFIPDAVPGDVVRAERINETDRYGDAKLLEVLTPSPARGPVDCQVASVCGGCQWFGMDYSKQLEWKLGFVTSSLQRIGKLKLQTPATIIPSPDLTGYRNRILVRMHINTESTGTGSRVGYFQRGTHVLVDVPSCAIAAPALNTVIERLRTLETSRLPATTVRVEMQVATREQGGATGVVITIYPAEGGAEAARALLAKLLQEPWPALIWAGLVFDLAAAPLVVFDRDEAVTYLTLPGQFQQVNLAHNRSLRGLIKSIATAIAPQRVLDVACGSGNLSLQLADGKRYIEGVEVAKKAIDCAWRSAEVSGVTNVNYLVADAEKHLWKCSRAGETFDLVILDPPRQGLAGGMAPLKSMAPKHIIYVSCDPTTLARDLNHLCRQDFYNIESVTALDFFPNTYHVETVVHLTRRDNPKDA